MSDQPIDDSCVLTHDVGSVRWITLNRPDNGNKFNPPMLRRLKSVLEDARMERDVRVVVITGAGDRFFCIGGEHDEKSADLDYATVMGVVDVYQFIDQMPKPVIAAVNGFAVGGGHVLQVMCDLTIAKASAIFRQVGPMVGSFDAGFGTWYLEDLIGRKRAKEMWFLNDKLTADQALAYGLVNRVVPDDQLVEETTLLANAVAERGAQALAAIKLSFAARTGGAGGFSRVAHDLLLRDYLQTEEAAELQSSFNERRPPDQSRFWR
ncbi:MAG TPA: enoyl-CoA hydratase-related protein [Jatrophihabitantaceae bacterium]|nr:enoyl-CoA hydratase-related protein [Jatrophihabitantaceae bacterium]